MPASALKENKKCLLKIKKQMVINFYNNSAIYFNNIAKNLRKDFNYVLFMVLFLAIFTFKFNMLLISILLKTVIQNKKGFD